MTGGTLMTISAPPESAKLIASPCISAVTSGTTSSMIDPWSPFTKFT